MLEKTVCELFAGVGGFRCGLNHIDTLNDLTRPESWNTVWFNQWEPSERTTQYAHDAYVYNFGTSLDLNNADTTNIDIGRVDKNAIPNFNLLVGGFPCQDYSVAASLSTSRGIEGKKGILWWSIREILEVKRPPFVLLENVDRLLKSPSKQRGRDFAIILACFRDLGYTVEWRVINAADYGYPQRRRRTFIFAYNNNTNYGQAMTNAFNVTEANLSERGITSTPRELCLESAHLLIRTDGFFSQAFPIINPPHIELHDEREISYVDLPNTIGEVSSSFVFNFLNSGVMVNGTIYTEDTKANYNGYHSTLGDVIEQGQVSNEYFIPQNRLYYTNPNITHSDETQGRLPATQRQTWQYLKGAKRMPRVTREGYEYTFSEGAIPMIDEYNKPARTMLTSEGTFNRSTHIVRDRQTGNIRLLTPEETERLQGFPSGITQYCQTQSGVVEMPTQKRRFMMGNALVVDLVKQMEPYISRIFRQEPDEQ
jgi:DNA (cytosine-5)-methyltransferase 1